MNKLIILIFNVPTLILLPQASFAASTSVGKIIYNLCDWLSGEIAAAVAVLVVIYSGYEMLQGEMENRKFLVRSVALGLIMGGAYIAKNILLS